MSIKLYFRPKYTYNIILEELEAPVKLDKLEAPIKLVKLDKLEVPLPTLEVPRKSTKPTKTAIKRG